MYWNYRGWCFESGRDMQPTSSTLSKETLSRRNVIRGGSAALIAAAIGSSNVAAARYGEDTPPVDFVETADGLVNAVENADDGAIVWIRSNATIDLTGREGIELRNVTLASGRGIDGPGAHLKCDDFPETLFVGRGNYARITGVRINGPENRAIDWPGYGSGKISTAIDLRSETGVVDNSRIWGWTRAAVSVGERRKPGCKAYLTDNDFHHCQMDGLGYGVCVSGGDADIRRNTFHNHRHAIAGTGSRNCSYTATQNFHSRQSNLHAFDMHGDSNDVAGDRIMIRRNTFMFDTTTGVRIRGVPNSGCWIRKNEFGQRSRPSSPGSSDSAYRQTDHGSSGWREFYPEDNLFGERRDGYGAPDDVIRRFWNIHG